MNNHFSLKLSSVAFFRAKYNSVWYFCFNLTLNNCIFRFTLLLLQAFLSCETTRLGKYDLIGISQFHARESVSSIIWTCCNLISKSNSDLNEIFYVPLERGVFINIDRLVFKIVRDLRYAIRTIHALKGDGVKNISNIWTTSNMNQSQQLHNFLCSF